MLRCREEKRLRSRDTKLMSFKINARKIEHKMQTYAIKWYTFKYNEGVLLYIFL